MCLLLEDFTDVWPESPWFQCRSVAFCCSTIDLKHKLFPTPLQSAFSNLKSLLMSILFLLEMKSSQSKFSCKLHFPGFWSSSFHSFGQCLSHASFLKCIALSVPIAVLSWAEWTLPVSYKETFICRAPNRLLSSIQLHFWFCLLELWEERKRLSLISEWNFCLILSSLTWEF